MQSIKSHLHMLGHSQQQTTQPQTVAAAAAVHTAQAQAAASAASAHGGAPVLKGAVASKSKARASGLRAFLELKLYQYELLTGIYMLTGPEKAMFNVVFWTLMTLSLWTMYTYGGDYAKSALWKAHYYLVESVDVI